MSESNTEVQVSINQIPFVVEETKRISYDDILKVTKLPQGSTVFYIDTKGKPDELRAGYLIKGESVAIADGLNISSFRLTDLLNEPEEEPI
jgi:hypothetical protein